MKRVLALLGISLGLHGLSVTAQDAPVAPPPPALPTVSASAIADQQAADERYKRMAADIANLQSDNELLKAKLAAVETQLQQLRDAQASAATNTAVQDDLQHLAAKIEEVDNKREADKAAISEEIKKSFAEVKKALEASTASGHSGTSKVTPMLESNESDKGFTYIIKSKDNLASIVAAYNADYKSKGLKTITLEQAEAANPNVDWKKLKIGQKIIVPRPPE